MPAARKRRILKRIDAAVPAPGNSAREEAEVDIQAGFPGRRVGRATFLEHEHRRVVAFELLLEAAPLRFGGRSDPRRQDEIRQGEQGAVVPVLERDQLDQASIGRDVRVDQHFGDEVLNDLQGTRPETGQIFHESPRSIQWMGTQAIRHLAPIVHRLAVRSRSEKQGTGERGLRQRDSSRENPRPLFPLNQIPTIHEQTPPTTSHQHTKNQ